MQEQEMVICFCLPQVNYEQQIVFFIFLFVFVLAVLMSELVKLVTCLAAVYIESGGVVQLLETLNKTIIKAPMDTLKVCVPSFVYVVQNNLLYISASHLDAATYQVIQ